MANKLQKHKGQPRIHSLSIPQEWKGFTLRYGFAYGMDSDGNLFVSAGHVFFEGGKKFLSMWTADYTSPVVCKRNAHPSPLMPGKYYSTEWSPRWKPSRLPVENALAVRILAKRREFAAGCPAWFRDKSSVSVSDSLKYGGMKIAFKNMA